jgi:uncharacterized RDD family membrane protein YckC
MLDTLRQVTTPELIEVQLHPAGLMPRALAWLLDWAIRAIILIIAIQILARLAGFGMGLSLLLWFLLEWFYPVLFEVLWRGYTPGKKVMGLAVIHDNGSPVGWGASMTRNLLRTADFLPFLYGFGIISMLLHNESRRLGDIVAGTLVVYRDQPRALPELPEHPPIVPAFPLDRATQRTLVAFAERSPGLTPARQEELADLVPHLSTSSSSQQGAARLLGLASQVIGRRQ